MKQVKEPTLAEVIKNFKKGKAKLEDVESVIQTMLETYQTLLENKYGKEIGISIKSYDWVNIQDLPSAILKLELEHQVTFTQKAKSFISRYMYSRYDENLESINNNAREDTINSLIELAIEEYGIEEVVGVEGRSGGWLVINDLYSKVEDSIVILEDLIQQDIPYFLKNIFDREEREEFSDILDNVENSVIELGKITLCLRFIGVVETTVKTFKKTLIEELAYRIDNDVIGEFKLLDNPLMYFKKKKAS